MDVSHKMCMLVERKYKTRTDTQYLYKVSDLKGLRVNLKGFFSMH